MSRFPTRSLQPPLLYLITDRKRLAPAESLTGQLGILRDFLRSAIHAGVGLIQIREKDLDAGVVLQFAKAVVADARGSGTSVLVNERFDIAIAAGADGVHLTSSSIPPEKVREIAGPRFLIGASTHSASEVEAVERCADFAVLGPVYPTTSKSEYSALLGLDRFREIARRSAIPLLALGGVGESVINETLAAGAAGVAGISLFTSGGDLTALVRRVCSAAMSSAKSP